MIELEFGVIGIFTISEQNYVKCAQLNAVPSQKARIIHLVIDVLLFIAGGVCFLYGYMVLAGGLVGASIGSNVFPYILKVSVFPFFLKRHYRRYRQIQKPMTVELTASGLSFSHEAGSSAIKWSDIYAWRKNENYILIYIAPRLYHMLPARLSEQDFPIDKLKIELSENVGVAT